MRQLAALFLALVLTACSAAPDKVSTAGAEPVRIDRTVAARNIAKPQKHIQLADYLVIDKSKRMLVAYSNGKPIRAYRNLQFGDAPKGHKRFQGDERTPEGTYRIDWRNPQSRFHLSLRISYPNDTDRAFASQYGLSPGGDIFIHGQPNQLTRGRMRGDWTDGCIALTNEEIEELWQIVPNGTPIEIRP